MPDPIIPPQEVQQPIAGVPPVIAQQQSTPDAGAILSPANKSTDLGNVNVLAKGSNIERADVLKKKAEVDKNSHPNEQMDPLGMIFGILSGNLSAVHRAYNGGHKFLDEGTTADGRTVFKERNANGATDRYFERTPEEGFKELSDDQVQEIKDKGGVVTQYDTKNLHSGTFKGLSEVEQARKTGLALPAIKAMNTATDVARIASQSSNAIHQLNKLTSETNVLDIWKTLPEADRKRIIEYTNFQKGNTSGQTGGTTNSSGNSATEQNTTGFHGDVSGKPLGAKAGGGVSASSSTSGTASENRVNETGSSAGSSFSGHGNQESEILSMLQNKVKNPKEVQDLMNWVRWNRKVNEYDSIIPAEVRAPGSRATINPELAFTDRTTTLKNNADRIANNATQAAYAEFLARKVRTNDIGKGEQALQQEFLNSNKYKAIQNTYDNVREGREVPAKEGNLRITKSNKVEIYEDGEWRPANVR